MPALLRSVKLQLHLCICKLAWKTSNVVKSLDTRCHCFIVFSVGIFVLCFNEICLGKYTKFKILNKQNKVLKL